jgi:hypothetical protein
MLAITDSSSNQGTDSHRWSILVGALRDTVLPKLIPGEMRAENAERFMADTTP